MSIKRAILKKLFRHRYIGGRHTEIKNAIKGFPPHLIKEVRQEIQRLIKENYLLAKISTGEIHISLNPKMLDKIKEEIS